MTIDQKKISLINWITNLEDESVIEKIEDFRSSTLSELPKEIVGLLKISDATNEKDCIQHTSARDLLT